MLKNSWVGLIIITISAVVFTYSFHENSSPITDAESTEAGINIKFVTSDDKDPASQPNQIIEIADKTTEEAISKASEDEQLRNVMTTAFGRYNGGNYQLARPEQSMAAEESYLLHMRCRNFINNLLLQYSVEEITEDIAQLNRVEITPQNYSTIQRVYNRCNEKTGFTATVFTDLQEIDALIEGFRNSAIDLGNERVAKISAQLYLNSDANTQHDYDSPAKKQKLNSLHKLAEKGNRASATILLHLYTDPKNIYDFNVDKARQVLRDYYKLDGEALEQELNDYLEN